METFKITQDDGFGGTRYEEVQGDRILIDDLPCFIFTESSIYYERFNISHLETGNIMASGSSFSEATRKAFINYKKWPAAIDACRSQLSSRGIVLPVNV